MIINFGWLINDKIAGFGYASGINYQWERDDNELVTDIESLSAVGIQALVSLTEHPLQECVSEKFTYLHLPIEDMHPPTYNDIVLFIDFTKKMESQKKSLGVHCHAGLGRTGTMLACYLVYKGESPQAAIEQVRRKRPGSIETLDQEEAIIAYAEAIKKQKSKELLLNLN